MKLPLVAKDGFNNNDFANQYNKSVCKSNNQQIDYRKSEVNSIAVTVLLGVTLF